MGTHILGGAEEITHGVGIINTDHAAIHLGYGMCASLYLASLAPLAVKIYRYKGQAKGETQWQYF